MEGEAPNEGGCSVAATYSTYCCENHVAPGVGLIEPEKSFCDITARRPTLRSAVTKPPSVIRILGFVNNQRKCDTVAREVNFDGSVASMI